MQGPGTIFTFSQAAMVKDNYLTNVLLEHRGPKVSHLFTCMFLDNQRVVCLFLALFLTLPLHKHTQTHFRCWMMLGILGKSWIERSESLSLCDFPLVETLMFALPLCLVLLLLRLLCITTKNEAKYTFVLTSLTKVYCEHDPNHGCNNSQDNHVLFATSPVVLVYD